MSSTLWDWVAAVNGIPSGGTPFIPLYWYLPAKLTLRFGWAPSAETMLAGFVFLSLVGVVLFLRHRRNGWLLLSFLVWGALLADTPYVLAMPVALTFVVSVLRRRSERGTNGSWRPPDIPWKLLHLVCNALLVCAVMMVFHLVREGFDGYMKGYARAALRWEGGGFHPLEKAAMDKLLEGYVDEIAREAKGRTWLFTDGTCDAGIGLAGAREDAQSSRTVSLSDGPHDEAHWKALGFTQREDLAALKAGVPSLFRAWAVDRPANLTNAAFQCGFAFLEREAKGRYFPVGLVMSGRAPSAEEKARAEERVRTLAEQIVAFYGCGGDPQHGGRRRAARFGAMQWRVARAIRR